MLNIPAREPSMDEFQPRLGLRPIIVPKRKLGDADMGIPQKVVQYHEKNQSQQCP